MDGWLIGGCNRIPPSSPSVSRLVRHVLVDLGEIRQTARAAEALGRCSLTTHPLRID